MKVVRHKTRDVAFSFRMGAGFAGEVNRAQSNKIEPALNDTQTPVASYGHAVLVDTTDQTVRPFAAGDTAVTVAYGVAVRPYPFQQSSATNFGDIDIGAATPPAGAIDILRSGYIMAKVNGSPRKGQPVFVWCAASAGANIQGQFVATATGGSTAALANATFNGTPDSAGVVEIAFNV
jgi:hypothetical protein